MHKHTIVSTIHHSDKQAEAFRNWKLHNLPNRITTMKPVHEMPWLELLDQLRNASEKECADLLESEKHGKRRFNYLMRIFMKYNKLRYQRERRELLVLTGDQEVDGTIKLLLRSPEDTVKHETNIK